jgi:CRISPR/Cas system CMR-associated protein Cmr1 (group 7 of RAMP superfamily)
LLTLEERAAYILNSLERLADKFVIWGEDEMKEMSEEFQMMLRAKKLEQSIAINRIQFCQQLLMRREDFPEFL